MTGGGQQLSLLGHVTHEPDTHVVIVSVLRGAARATGFHEEVDCGHG